MKSNKKTLYMIGGGVAAVVTVAAPTLGVVYGTKDWKYHNPQRSTGHPIEEFFDDKIASTKSSYLSEKIVSPVGGTDLSSSFIILDPNWIDYDHIQKMVQTDGTGRPIDITKDIIEKLTETNVKNKYGLTPDEYTRFSYGTLNINTSDYSSQEQIEEKLKNINEMLRDYNTKLTQTGDHKKIGLYTYPVFNTRSIAIRIYELKDFDAEDQVLINGLMKYINLPEVNDPSNPWIHDLQQYVARVKANPNDQDTLNSFPQMFGGEHYFEVGRLMHVWFRLAPDDQTAMNEIGTRLNPLPSTATPEEVKAAAAQELIRIEAPDRTHGTIDGYTRLQEDIRFTGSEDDHEFHNLRSFWDKNMVVTLKPTIDLTSQMYKVVFSFYKFDKTDPTVAFSDGQTQRVFNPTNIQTVVKAIPLSAFGDTNSVIDNTPENRELFTKMMLDPNFNSYIKWIKQPLTEPGLDILGSVIPTLKPPVSKMVNLWKRLERLNEKFPEFSKEIFSDSNLKELFDKLQQATSINAAEFWQVCVVDFQTDLETFWTSLEKLGNLDRRGMYKLYNMTAGFDIISTWIENKISENPKYAQYAMDDESASALSSLLYELKKQKVVSEDFQVTDILNDPKHAAQTIVKGILNAHTFSLEPKDSSLLIGLITQFIKLSPEAQHNVEDPLSKFISSPDGIQKLLKLILGEHTADDLLNVVFSGNYMKIIEFIATNKHVDARTIQSVAQIAAATGIIPSSIASILPTSQTAATMVANIFNKGAMADIFTGVEHVLDDGIGGIDEARLERLVESFRDSVENQHTVNLLDVFTNVKSPFEILPIVSKLETDVASLSTWGGVKTLLADVEKLLNPSTTIKFGNTGKTIYQVVDHLKQLVDASKIADDSSLTDAITSLMLDTANSQKILETLIGIAIYAGSDSVDKTNDQLFPIVGTLIGSFVSKINWNAEPIKGMLPMALDLIIHGTDYDMKSGTIWEDLHPDKVDNINKFIDHIFAQAKEAGFNIDAYRSETHDGMDWLSNLFDGSVDANGKSTIEKLIENIHAGNPVADISSYVTNDLITFVVKQLMGPLQHGLISSSANTQAGIPEDTIKNLLNLVKNFAPSLSSMDVDTVSKLVSSVLTNGVAGLSDDDWNKIIPMITGILPDSIKNIVTPELVRGVLFGFKSVDEIKAIVDKIDSSLWDKDLAGLKPGEILTEIYNGNFHGKSISIVTAVIPQLNSLHALLTKGFLNITEDDGKQIVNAIKGEFSNLKTNLIDNFIVAAIAKGKMSAEIWSALSNYIPKLAAFGTEVNDLVSEVQKLILNGLGGLDEFDINKIISSAKHFIEKLKPIIPDLAKNETITKVESVLSLLENKGQAIYNLLHNGFGGTTPENIGKSEVIVSILKEFVSLPSMIMDYIPKIIVGQGNIDNVRVEVAKEIDAIPIPKEITIEDGALKTWSDKYKALGKFVDLSTEASRLFSIVKDTSKPISEMLDALSKYKEKINAMQRFNSEVQKLNDADKARIIVQAEIDDYISNAAKHSVSLVDTSTQSQTKVGQLTASSFILPPAPSDLVIRIKSISASGTNKTNAVVTVEVSSQTLGTVPKTYDVTVSGFAESHGLSVAELVAGIKKLLSDNKIAISASSTGPTMAGKAEKLIKDFLLANFPSAHNEINALHAGDLITAYKDIDGNSPYAAVGVFYKHSDATSYADLKQFLVVPKYPQPGNVSSTMLPRIAALFDALDK